MQVTINETQRPFTMAYRDIFQGLNATEKGVVLTLMDYGQQIFPSHARLSKDAGIPVRSLQRILVQLRDKGKVFWRPMEGGVNHYFVVGHNLETSANMAEGSANMAEGGTPGWRRGYANMADKQDTDNQTHGTRTTKNQPPAAAEGAPMPIKGELLPDEPDPEEKRKGFPLNFHGTVDYFTNEARKLHMDGDIGRTRKHISRMHKQDGLSYDQIHGIIRMFFTKYERDLVAKRGDYTAIAMFQQMHRRLINQKPVPATGESVVTRVQREDPSQAEIRRLIEEKRNA